MKLKNVRIHRKRGCKEIDKKTGFEDKKLQETFFITKFQSLVKFIRRKIWNKINNGSFSHENSQRKNNVFKIMNIKTRELPGTEMCTEKFDARNFLERKITDENKCWF